MANLIGQNIGPYRILEQIGQGGMATVYKAYQPSMDRYVAVKVLPPHFMQDPNFVERFKREARTIARLEHPHILPVHDYGKTDSGTTYIAMRYIEAGTLNDLQRQGTMSLDDAVRLFEQIADALAYAHEQGVVHRDMKPSNILVDPRGQAFLTDFGLARMIEGSSNLTGSMILGTPSYMAPELGEGKPADERSDIYALGVILYELTTGRLPFEAETPLAVMLKHMTEPLPLPRSLNPAIPEPVERIILKALAKEPESRYQNVNDMILALRRAISRAPTIASPAVPPLKSPQKPKNILEQGLQLPRPPWLWPAIGGAAAFFILACCLLTFISRNAKLNKETEGALPPVELTATARVEATKNAPTPTEPEKPAADANAFKLKGRIAFVSDRDGNNEIYILKEDGELLRLTNNPAADTEPVWSPDGAKLAFVSNRDGNEEIYILGPDGQPKRMTNNPAADRSPVWSSDGAKLAFISDRDGNDEVYLLDSQGEITRMTSNPASEQDLVWSPDGTKFAFASDRDGDYEIYILGADGEPKQMTNNRAADREPIWSPDGAKLAFASDRDGDYEIYILGADGEPQQMTNNRAADREPIWSPDGAMLAFVSNRDGKPQIYILNSNGETHPLSKVNSRDGNPAWSR